MARRNDQGRSVRGLIAAGCNRHPSGPGVTSIRNPKNPEALTLSGAQWIAVQALARGDLKLEAARQAGVHPQTVSQWIRQGEFRAALESVRAECLEDTLAQMQTLAGESLSTLRQTLISSPPALRLKAAMYVLDRVLLVPGPHGTPPGADAALDGDRLLVTMGLVP